MLVGGEEVDGTTLFPLKPELMGGDNGHIKMSLKVQNKGVGNIPAPEKLSLQGLQAHLTFDVGSLTQITRRIRKLNVLKTVVFLPRVSLDPESEFAKGGDFKELVYLVQQWVVTRHARTKAGSSLEDSYHSSRFVVQALMTYDCEIDACITALKPGQGLNDSDMLAAGLASGLLNAKSLGVAIIEMRNSDRKAYDELRKDKKAMKIILDTMIATRFIILMVEQHLGKSIAPEHTRKSDGVAKDDAPKAAKNDQKVAPEPDNEETENGK